MIELTKDFELKLRNEVAFAKSEAVILATLVKNEMMDGVKLALELFALSDRLKKIDEMIKLEVANQIEEMDKEMDKQEAKNP